MHEVAIQVIIFVVTINFGSRAFRKNFHVFLISETTPTKTSLSVKYQCMVMNACMGGDIPIKFCVKFKCSTKNAICHENFPLYTDGIHRKSECEYNTLAKQTILRRRPYYARID